MSGSLLAGLALVAVTAAVATFALTAPVAARDHDDPIVIDNPRISVGRAKGMPPLQGSESSRWVLHDMDTFHKLVVTTTSEGQTTTFQRPLYGHKLVRFALVADSQRAAASFSISLASGGQHHERVIVQAHHDDLRFELDPQNAARIADRDGTLHIGEIQVGNGYICLADTAKPVDGPCSTWQNVPDAVRILVCANDECAMTAHP